MAQFRLFTEAALHSKQNDLVLQALNFRASQYEEKDFEKHIKALTDG